MAPRDRLALLEKLAQSVEKAMAGALQDKVTRSGVVLSPYYSKRLRDLIGELNHAKEANSSLEEGPNRV